MFSHQQGRRIREATANQIKQRWRNTGVGARGGSGGTKGERDEGPAYRRQASGTPSTGSTFSGKASCGTLEDEQYAEGKKMGETKPRGLDNGTPTISAADNGRIRLPHGPRETGLGRKTGPYSVGPLFLFSSASKSNPLMFRPGRRPRVPEAQLPVH